MYNVYSSQGVLLGTYHNVASVTWALKNVFAGQSVKVREGFAFTH
jgi:hypothetical protein